MALMIGAFIIQGITPGPNVIRDEPALFWGIIVSMWVGNLMLVLLNLPLIGLWVKLLTIPYRVLFPAIIAFACIGTYSIASNTFDIYAIAVFGIIGYVLVKLGCEPAPLLLGFVLGPLLEEHLRRAMIISRGDPMIFLERPDLGDAARPRRARHRHRRPALGPQEARRGLRRGGLMLGTVHLFMLTRRVRRQQLAPFVFSIVGYENPAPPAGAREPASLDVPLIVSLAGGFRIAFDRPARAGDRMRELRLRPPSRHVAIVRRRRRLRPDQLHPARRPPRRSRQPMDALPSRLVAARRPPPSAPADRLAAAPAAAGASPSPRPGPSAARRRPRRRGPEARAAAAAFRLLVRTHGAQFRIERLADRLGWSRKRLAARFRDGLRPDPEAPRPRSCRFRRAEASRRRRPRTGPTSPPPAATPTSRTSSASSARLAGTTPAAWSAAHG